MASDVLSMYAPATACHWPIVCLIRPKTHVDILLSPCYPVSDFSVLSLSEHALQQRTAVQHRDSSMHRGPDTVHLQRKNESTKVSIHGIHTHSHSQHADWLEAPPQFQVPAAATCQKWNSSACGIRNFTCRTRTSLRVCCCNRTRRCLDSVEHVKMDDKKIL